MAIDYGWDGAVKVGNATVSYMTEWTLEMTGDALEKTNFGSSHDREYTPGLRSHTVSFSGYSEDTDTAQMALLAEMTTAALPAAVTLTLVTNAGGGFTGSGILTGITRGATPDGLQTFSANAQINGLLSTV